MQPLPEAPRRAKVEGGEHNSSSQASAPEQEVPKSWEHGLSKAGHLPSPQGHSPSLNRPNIPRLPCFLLCSSLCLDALTPHPTPHLAISYLSFEAPLKCHLLPQLPRQK